MLIWAPQALIHSPQHVDLIVSPNALLCRGGHDAVAFSSHRVVEPVRTVMSATLKPMRASERLQAVVLD